MKRKAFIVLGLMTIALISYGIIFHLYNQLSDIPLLNGYGWFSGPRADRKNRYLLGKEETITFYAAEGQNPNMMIARKATIIKRPGAKITAFIFHGFMCNKNDIRFLGNSLFSEPIGGMPINTVIIDFRAHGEMPEGQYCTFGCLEKNEVKGIVDYVKNDPDLKDTMRIAYGFSMGAVSSIRAQAEDPSLFSIAVWDCPFESTEKVIARALNGLKLSLFGYDIPVPGRSILKRYAFNPTVQSMIKAALKTIAKMDMRQIETCIMPVETADSMKDITIPAMFISCYKDDKAPTESVKELYEMKKGYKRLWITNGREHFDSYFFNPEKYIYKVRRFYQKVLDGTIKNRYQDFVSEDDPEFFKKTANLR